jgi:hypothetical protein
MSGGAKKLDIEEAFRKAREAAQLPDAAETRNSLKPKPFDVRAEQRYEMLGDALLALFALFMAAFAFAAVFRLLAGSRLALYGALTAAAVAGGLTAPLRYQWLGQWFAHQALPFSVRPQKDLPELTGEQAEIRRDLQRMTIGNRVLMRLALFAYVLCLWLLSVTQSPSLHGAHTLLLIFAFAAPALAVAALILSLS